ncbi:hypothetical protein [Geminicoccus harenae]|uniref:hypothetical protein n=1 Tax=Geminicoccus harenae TaxID=2498453 RepID=UPI001C9812A1|nr:hypothetical protein [Geminicoccus harenae]
MPAQAGLEVGERVATPEGPARSGMLLLACLFGGLYAAQAIAGCMVQTALPTVLRDAGMALDRLSFLYVLFLPWALKFLWAPAIGPGEPRDQP